MLLLLSLICSCQHSFTLAMNWHAHSLSERPTSILILQCKFFVLTTLAYYAEVLQFSAFIFTSTTWDVWHLLTIIISCCSLTSSNRVFLLLRLTTSTYTRHTNCTRYALEMNTQTVSIYMIQNESSALGAKEQGGRLHKVQCLPE